jgi:predicted enzyme involved in methoxymalonyl-ACP biosynthesis
MMDELVRRCKEKGVKKIIGHYYPTAKNGMVKDFYSLQGFDKISEDEKGNTDWLFEIGDDYILKNEVIEVADI